MNYKKSLTSLLMLGLLSFAAPAFADNTIKVAAGSYTSFYGKGVSSVAIADPSVADVIIANGEVMLVGKKAGATNMFVWRNGSREAYTLLVNGQNTASAAMIKSAIGIDTVDVTAAGGQIVLEGSVPNQYDKVRAEKIASGFGSVVNMLELHMPRQVRVECRILDISKTDAKDLGMKVGGTGDTDVAESFGSFGLGQSHSNGIDGNIFHWFGSYAEINAQITALVKKGNAKVLSQPYIITMSGDKADVFIGGQIAVTSTSNNDVNTEWKDYGIKLEIEPVVQNNGLIDSKINTEVSDLDYANKSATGVPAITTRRANTHVMMKPGMTMAIGGLISSDQSKHVSKLPLLGDIPVLGHFFRYTSKSKTRREIIILLTPINVDSDYMPVMSNEMRRIARLKDEEVIRGDLYAEPKEKK